MLLLYSSTVLLLLLVLLRSRLCNVLRCLLKISRVDVLTKNRTEQSQASLSSVCDCTLDRKLKCSICFRLSLRCSVPDVFVEANRLAIVEKRDSHRAHICDRPLPRILSRRVHELQVLDIARPAMEPKGLVSDPEDFVCGKVGCLLSASNRSKFHQ